jgi:hypothetical protein
MNILNKIKKNTLWSKKVKRFQAKASIPHLILIHLNYILIREKPFLLSNSTLMLLSGTTKPFNSNLTNIWSTITKDLHFYILGSMMKQLNVSTMPYN